MLAPRATPPATYDRWRIVLRANAVMSGAYLISVNRETGAEEYVYNLEAPGSWSSPAIVDDKLIIVSNYGIMRVFNIADEFQPVLLWSFQVSESNIEATPAVWKDMIYVGARDGYMYAIGQKDS